MASSPPSTLTPLQNDLLRGFFGHERRWFLTGGAALGGFYFGHRDTEDLDFFGEPGLDLEDAARALAAAAGECGALITPEQRFPDFRRYVVRRGEESCIVDLVIDRAPPVDRIKTDRGAIRIDTLREIAANKVCTLLGRAQIKDLVDMQQLLGAGISLDAALADALTKDGGADPATLAWILSELTISPDARLPGGVDAVALERFRADLVIRLQKLAFEQARK